MQTGILRLHPEQIIRLKQLLDDHPDTHAIDVSEIEHDSLHVVAHSEDGWSPAVGTLSVGGTWRDIEVVL